MMAEEDTYTTGIVNETNKALDGLLCENKPRVCFCCNCLLMGEHKQRWFTIKSLHEIKAEFVDNNLSPPLLKDYMYVDEDTPNWISKIMISNNLFTILNQKRFLHVITVIVA
jgi:hypothetical protein